MTRSLAAIVIFAMFGAAGDFDRSGQAGNGPQEPFAMRVVATGLADPFQIIWGPDGFLWVTERTGGRITRVQPSDGLKAAAITIGEVIQGEGGNGLLGMAL